ncbi:tetratricopeptide repeat protein 27-like isoform X2 [Corticium candelabrum]|uniref:tetratricopeptide repeat protein 27-like isoform X2 n=1 Tax=Corticium candelabrum TaxID=121492 RepID=UPI002E2601AC|nr:tetratricopeptide repeat protein 27-like isoform X2 [Corticium candelabrum]
MSADSFIAIELALLQQDASLVSECISHDGFGIRTAAEMASCVVSGQYRTVIDNPTVSACYPVPQEALDGVSPPHDTQLLFLLNAVAHLQLFLQENWTGPPVRGKDAGDGDGVDCMKEVNEKALDALICDGEAVYHLTANPYLLQSAKAILVDNSHLIRQCLSWSWWTLRCLVTYQHVLDNMSASIYDTLVEVVKAASEEDSQLMQLISQSKALQCQWHLEVGHACLLYGQVTQAQEHLLSAKTLCGLKINLTGALGKRTRYQEKSTAQLVLEVSREDGREPLGWSCCYHKSDFSDMESSHYPRNVDLQDDVLLDEMKFVDPDVGRPLMSLTALDQAVILAECRLLWKSNPSHKLTTEELNAYLSQVLQTKLCWSIYCAALFWRSHLEETVTRKVERAMAQTQALVDKALDFQPEVLIRLHLLHASGLPSRWMIEHQLAKILQSLGCTESALEIYHRLELWENVIICYQQQNRRGQAETVIRERLKERETPELLCYLGDATLDPVHYERAWEVSNHRSARAQRSLGLHYLRRKLYKECISSFQKTLALNTLQGGVWFSLGCAALQTCDLELAIRAFRKCVLIDSENFEAWNNLAASFIKKRDKHKAFGALKEALRCDYENWKVWENYLLVCSDINETNEVIKAYHRLLDLRDKYVDEDVLTALVHAVALETQAATQSGRGLYGKAAELFGRLTSKTTGNSIVWKLYSRLHRSHYELQDESTETFDKVLLCLQKAVNCRLQTTVADRDVTALNETIELCVELAQTCRRFAELKKDAERDVAIKTLSSVKLNVRSILARVKKLENENAVTEDALEGVAKLQSELSLVVHTIECLKNGRE